MHHGANKKLQGVTCDSTKSRVECDEPQNVCGVKDISPRRAYSRTAHTSRRERALDGKLSIMK